MEYFIGVNCQSEFNLGLYAEYPINFMLNLVRPPFATQFSENMLISEFELGNS